MNENDRVLLPFVTVLQHDFLILNRAPKHQCLSVAPRKSGTRAIVATSPQGRRKRLPEHRNLFGGLPETDTERVADAFVFRVVD